MVSVGWWKWVVYVGALLTVLGIILGYVGESSIGWKSSGAALEFLQDGGFSYFLLGGVCLLVAGCTMLALRLPAKSSYSVSTRLLGTIAASVAAAFLLSAMDLLTFNVHGWSMMIPLTLLAMAFTALLCFCISFVRSLKS